MVYLDNSAGRLHRVLARLVPRAGNAALSRSWAVALGDEELRGRDLQRQIMAVVDLADQARYDTLDCVDDGEENAPLLRWMEPVMKVQAIAFQDTRTDAVTQYLAPDVMLSLETAAWELHRRRPDPKIDSTQGQAARDAIAEVIAALRDDDQLDQETRDLLIRQAAALQHALELAWLTGPNPVKDALAGVVGGLAMATMKSADATAKPPVLSKVAGVIEVVANLLTIAQGSAAMIAVAPQIAGLLGAS